MTTSLKTASVPSQDWTPRDVIDHQFTHGVRPAPRPACAGDCSLRECAGTTILAAISDVVTDYLSRPFAAGETAMPLVLLRTWLGWRMRDESPTPRPRHALVPEVLERVTWALNQPHSGLVVAPISKSRQVAA